MGNQYSEQYYIDKIVEMETSIEEKDNILKKQDKMIKALNSKMDLLTTAMSAIIQKNKQADELVESLSQFKEFFESNPHIYRLEEYDEDFTLDDDDDNNNENNEEKKAPKNRKQPKRKCKVKQTPQRIQPKRAAKKATQPHFTYITDC